MKTMILLASSLVTLAAAPVSADHTCDGTEPEKAREWCESHEGPLGIGPAIHVEAEVGLPCPIFNYDCWNCWLQVQLGAWRVCD